MQIHRAFILLAMLALCKTALAQEPLPGLNDTVTRDKAFLPVYTRYLEAINTRGIDGLKDLTASNFTLKWDRESRTGAKALQELKKYIPDPKKGDEIHEILTSVKLRRLVFIGDRAIVQTEETGLLVGDKSANKMTMSWNWKQTWRKTPEGWRLILWEQGTNKLSPAAVTVSYTVTWTPKNAAPASTPPSPSGTGDTTGSR